MQRSTRRSTKTAQGNFRSRGVTPAELRAKVEVKTFADHQEDLAAYSKMAGLTVETMTANLLQAGIALDLTVEAQLIAAVNYCKQVFRAADKTSRHPEHLAAMISKLRQQYPVK